MAPIWLPHWPACRWTIFLILQNATSLELELETEDWSLELGEWPAGVPPADCPCIRSLPLPAEPRPPLHHHPANPPLSLLSLSALADTLIECGKAQIEVLMANQETCSLQIALKPCKKTLTLLLHPSQKSLLEV